jgi:Ser/Thr protein kinase RdoA (MazF antagonist)
MSNMERVTRHLRNRVARMEGHDPDRESPTLVPAGDGLYYVHDPKAGYWRMFQFIPESRSFDTPENPSMMEAAGRAYGRFLVLLSDLPGSRLHETILAFHDLDDRLVRFRDVVRNDAVGRVRKSWPEIRWVESRAEDLLFLSRLRAEGRIPERITHNDTKLNNVLFDSSGNALCVVDLDTVMPGIVHYDFGDTVRSGAATGAEDETDLSRMGLDLALFGAFAAGFLGETRSFLTPMELKTLYLSPRFMTFIIGLRFLTDHLEGDRYFKIHSEGHNLQRARAQFRLVESMEQNQQEMERIVHRMCR